MRTTLSLRVRFDVLRRDNYACTYCGAGPNATVLEVDHIVPVAAGGDDSPENLRTSCRECNAGKSDRYAGGEAQWGQSVQLPTFRPPLEDEESPRWFYRRNRSLPWGTFLNISWAQPEWAAFWQQPRQFSQQEAVIDLVMRSESARRRSVGDLAAAWHWNTDEVKAFTEWLVRVGIVYEIPKDGSWVEPA